MVAILGRCAVSQITKSQNYCQVFSSLHLVAFFTTILILAKILTTYFEKKGKTFATQTNTKSKHKFWLNQTKGTIATTQLVVCLLLVDDTCKTVTWHPLLDRVAVSPCSTILSLCRHVTCHNHLSMWQKLIGCFIVTFVRLAQRGRLFAIFLHTFLRNSQTLSPRMWWILSE